MVTDEKDRAPLSVTVQLGGLLAVLLVGAFVLLTLVIVVGLLRDSLNVTAVVSVLATMFGGILTGYLASQRKTPGGDET